MTLFDAGGIGLRYVLTADLRALDPSRTEVNIYGATRSSAKEAALWRNGPTPRSTPATATRTDRRVEPARLVLGQLAFFAVDAGAAGLQGLGEMLAANRRAAQSSSSAPCAIA